MLPFPSANTSTTEEPGRLLYDSCQWQCRVVCQLHPEGHFGEDWPRNGQKTCFCKLIIKIEIQKLIAC